MQWCKVCMCDGCSQGHGRRLDVTNCGNWQKLNGEYSASPLEKHSFRLFYLFTFSFMFSDANIFIKLFVILALQSLQSHKMVIFFIFFAQNNDKFQSGNVQIFVTICFLMQCLFFWQIWSFFLHFNTNICILTPCIFIILLFLMHSCLVSIEHYDRRLIYNVGVKRRWISSASSTGVKDNYLLISCLKQNRKKYHLSGLKCLCRT